MMTTVHMVLPANKRNTPMLLAFIKLSSHFLKAFIVQINHSWIEILS